MSQTAESPQQRGAAKQGWWPRTKQWINRARGSDSHERHTLALIGKSALAATVAWVIANDYIGAQSPAFAPFSAVVIMQVTVYQSLLQSLRYVGAVSAGVALQGLFGFMAGPQLVTFILVALAAMAIGRWRHLGSQGSQVTTAAFFAFSSYVSATSNTERLTQLGQIILLVVIGCAVGVLVNVTILPPMRYRSAESGIHTLAHSVCNLISDIFPVLRENELDQERTRHWRQRADDLPPLIAQAQASVDVAWESMFYNPRRWLQRRRKPATFSGYQEVVDALGRVTHQVNSLTRSLDRWHESESDEGYQGFMRDYSDFLESLAHITELFSQIDEDHLREQARELCQAAEKAQEKRNHLAEQAEQKSLPVGDLTQPYGILLVEATRLMDEFQYTCDVLQYALDEDEDRARRREAGEEEEGADREQQHGEREKIERKAKADKRERDEKRAREQDGGERDEKRGRSRDRDEGEDPGDGRQARDEDREQAEDRDQDREQEGRNSSGHS